MTLSKALISNPSRLAQADMVMGGSALIAMASQIQVPMYPVPMTLQTLAVLVVGLSFGSLLGLAALVVYLAEGAMGPLDAETLCGRRGCGHAALCAGPRMALGFDPARPARHGDGGRCALPDRQSGEGRPR